MMIAKIGKIGAYYSKTGLMFQALDCGAYGIVLGM